LLHKNARQRVTVPRTGENEMQFDQSKFDALLARFVTHVPLEPHTHVMAVARFRAAHHTLSHTL
jgi:hypothetical protein